MATSNLGFQNKFTTTLSGGISAADTTIGLTALPTPTEGYLVIEPDSSTAWEEIYYTSKTGSAVVCPSALLGRGVGGSTAASHSSGATVRMDTTAEMFTQLQNGTAFGTGFVTPQSLVAGTGTTWVWQTWTPTFTNLSGGTLNYSKSTQIGKQVFFAFKYTLGGAGVAGAVTFTSPVNLSGDMTATSEGINGTVALFDTGTSDNVGIMKWASASTIAVQGLDASFNYVRTVNLSSTIPHTWASTDVIHVTGNYQVA